MRQHSIRLRNQYKQKKAKKKMFGLFLLFTLLICLSYFGYKYYIQGKTDILNDTKNIVVPIIKKEPPKPKIQESELREKIATVLLSYPGVDTTIVISEPKNDVPIIIGNNEKYLGASTTKLISAIYYLSKVESGQRTLTQYFGSYTAEWHLAQLINQSNNASWDIFIKNLGYKNIENYAHQIGATSFNNNDNSIIASDTNLITKKLYNGELLNETHTNLLYSYMTGTNNEDLIPAYFTDGTEVLHKYGILYGNLHDTAIVKDKNSTYILTIYTNSDAGLYYETRMQLFHDIVKQVSWYQNNK